MRKRKWTDEQLIEAVNNSYCYLDIFKLLNLKYGGGQWGTIKRRVAALGLDTGHFLSKGDLSKRRPYYSKSLDDIFSGVEVIENTHHFKNRLIAMGLLINNCYICGIKPVWNEQQLSLQLDHIDGNRLNNSLDNLRILCPNCHSQTKTYAGKKNKTVV